MSEVPAGWRSVNGPLSSLRRGSGPRLVFVHGFTQTGLSWLPVAEHFIADCEVVLVDAPGHGRSSHIRAGLTEGAELLADTCGAADYVGYSMGGRLCLHLGIAHAELVRSLVVLGATGGIIDPVERAERLAADEALAGDLESSGVEAFVQKWLALPLFATLPDRVAGLADRLQNTADGLASSLRLAGTGNQEPLWQRLTTITAPTVVMAGELDPKFTELGHQLVGAIGQNAVFVPIPAAGHAAHLERPEAVAAAIRTLLKRNV